MKPDKDRKQAPDFALKDSDGKVSQAHAKLDLKDLPKGKWWWD